VNGTQSLGRARVAQKGLARAVFCAWDGESLVHHILGKPGVKQDSIGTVKGNQLQVSVTAPPVAGKTTDHMVRFLAEEFGVSANALEVVFGRFDVNKQLCIKSPHNLPYSQARCSAGTGKTPKHGESRW